MSSTADTLAAVRATDTPVDVLVTGVGAVGAYAVEFLARTPGLERVVALDVNADAAAGVAIRAESGAAVEGYSVSVEGHGADLRDVDATAELIAAMRPRAVLHIATLLPIGRMAKELEPAVFTRLRQAGFGTWMPVNALLSLQLVRAIEAAGTTTAFIDIPFPDFINPVLSRMGHDVLAGGGNVDNLVGQLRVGIARARGIGVDRVRVALVAPHAVAESFQREHSSSGWRYIARAYVDDVDVTAETDIEGLLGSTSAVIEHVALDSRVASSGVAMATAVATGRTASVHAAGPQGLVGGYPVSLSASGTEIMLPDGVTLDEAVAVNEAGLVAGGIASIEQDGTIVFTDDAVATMTELFGVTHATVDPASIGDHAAELVAAYRRYIEEHR